VLQDGEDALFYRAVADPGAAAERLWKDRSLRLSPRFAAGASLMAPLTGLTVGGNWTR
jgi:hypothetical protein